MGLLTELSQRFHGVSPAQHPSLTVISTVLGGITIIVLLRTVKQYLRLRHIKGPPSTGVSIFWLVKAVAGPKTYLDLWEATRRYGSLIRVGPNDLLTSDPYLWKHVCGARSPYTRSQWYGGMKFNPAKNNCLSWRDETEHQRLRSKMAAGYSGRAVEGLESKVDKNVLAFAKLLERYADEGKRIDFGYKAQYFTLDAISDIAFGEAFGFLQSDSDVYEYISTTERTVHMAVITSILPWLLKIVASPTFRRFLPSSEDQLGFGKVMGVAKKVAAERFGPNKKVQKDMLGSFVANGLTESEAESEILLQIIAGSDSTAMAIRCIILHVCTNPRILNKLRTEIATTKFDTAVIPDAVARTMPYLQAVIKEGLRIWPPITSILSKEVPPEGDSWKGVYLPGGTRIGVGTWSIFQDASIFGEDVSEYRPERWLEGSSERIKEMESTLELIFGYGRFGCLGKNVAMIELNKVFVHLLTQFDLTICNPTLPWKVKNPGIFNIFDFWVRAHKRELK